MPNDIDYIVEHNPWNENDIPDVANTKIFKGKYLIFIIVLDFFVCLYLYESVLRHIVMFGPRYITSEVFFKCFYGNINRDT